MIKRALALGLLFVSLVCSGYSYSGEDSHVTFEVTEDYVSESEDFGTLKLDGKCIKLPCRVSLFTELGYVINDDVDKIFPAKTESYGVNLYDTKGRKLSLFVRNDDVAEHTAEECMVWSVRYKPQDDTDYGFIDISFSGVTPVSTEMDMVTKLGLPGSTLEWNGVKSGLWSTKKGEYDINIEYSSDGIVSMSLSSDTPAESLESASRIYYDKYYEEHPLSGTRVDEGTSGLAEVEYPSPQPSERKGLSVVVWIVIGIPLLVVFVGGILVWLAIRAHHKQRMAEIDAAILNTPIDEITDDLEDKYKV